MGKIAAGVLGIDLDVAGEAVTVSYDDTNATIANSGTITRAGSLFGMVGVTRIVVTDSGSLTGQSLTFAAVTASSLSGGLSGSGVETVTFNNAVTATGATTIDVTRQVHEPAGQR